MKDYCINCKGELTGSAATKLIQGEVELRRDRPKFIMGRFEDGLRQHWVCRACSIEHSIDPTELDEDFCSMCGTIFQPRGTTNPETVIKAHRCILVHGGTGNSSKYVSQEGGLLHYNCAVDYWELDLWSLYHYSREAS